MNKIQSFYSKEFIQARSDSVIFRIGKGILFEINTGYLLGNFEFQSNVITIATAIALTKLSSADFSNNQLTSKC